MKDRIFWKLIAVGVVFGLFAIAYGLCRNGQAPPLSFSSPAYAADPAPPKKLAMKFDFLQSNQRGRNPNSDGQWDRVKVPHGWLVFYYESGGRMMQGQGEYPAVAALTFYPDPNHEWDGSSLK